MPKSRAMREQIGQASEVNPYINEGTIDPATSSGGGRSSAVGEEVRGEVGAAVKHGIGTALGADMGVRKPGLIEQVGKVGVKTLLGGVL